LLDLIDSTAAMGGLTISQKSNFGSYAREEAHQDSDLDILAEFHEEATLLDLAAMGNFLEE